MVLEPKLCDFTHTILFVWPSNTINYMQCLIGIFLYELTYQHIRSWICSLIANWFWFRRSTFNVFNSLNLQLKAHISINSCIICDLSSVLILVHSETCMPLPPMRCSFLIPLSLPSLPSVASSLPFHIWGCWILKMDSGSIYGELETYFSSLYVYIPLNLNCMPMSVYSLSLSLPPFFAHMGMLKIAVGICYWPLNQRHIFIYNLFTCLLCLFLVKEIYCIGLNEWNFVEVWCSNRKISFDYPSPPFISVYTHIFLHITYYICYNSFHLFFRFQNCLV